MLYQRLTKRIIKRFDAGKFVAGEKFLTLNEICKHYKVSDITARKIIKELVKANYIESAPGRGSVVKDRPRLKQILLATNFSSQKSRICIEIFDGILKECNRWDIELQYVGYEELKNIHDDKKTGYIISGDMKRDLAYCQENYGDKYKRIVSYNDLKHCAFLPSCILNLKKATKIALEHLISRGHRRIAIMGSKDNPSYESRFKAYKEILSKNNIDYDDSLFKSFPISHDYSKECEESLKDLMNLSSAPTAIFCVSGFYALKLLNVCQLLKVKVPEDLSIIAVDNYAEMNFVRPRITTVDTHFSQMGMECVRMLLEQAAKPDIKIKNRIVEPHLIIRDSVKRI